ncbi:hypothetical protein N752_20750 [Desulforamulus aquiferis]|nr:coproporphyrinogen dehydrogenase HemZ [Desulforamulus aquiferis]RYD03264.1 hypothetical protein N752_20750 [Desulforamulus aquiferis]
MIIGLTGEAVDYVGTIQDIIWLFFPGAELLPNNTAGTYIKLEFGNEGNGLWAEAQFYHQGAANAYRENGTPLTPGEEANEFKRLAKLVIYLSLAAATSQLPSPWGIMTGIRPTKVVHRLLDFGWSPEKVQGYLVDKYALSQDKALQITDIAGRQRSIILTGEQMSRFISIYIGIPFCPSRCLYCSFPSYPIKRNKLMVEDFFKALIEEIKRVGEMIKSRNLIVQTIYLGGGTPTSLNLDMLLTLMDTINLYLKDSNTVEFTVEGGRPDTLSTEVLTLLAEAGVDRLSINPQSMVEKTLKVIGRAHSIEDIYQAMAIARKVKFKTINMDLIIGLPGETPRDVQETVNRVIELAPENLTIHSLAVKRASDLKQRLEEFPQASAEEAVEMWQITANGALALGQHPYYMYRQKQMVGNLENIGYTKPGHACIYNVQIIEERQTIVGLGVGAGSKWLIPTT